MTRLGCVSVCTYLVTDYVNLVLHLRNPLTNNGEQLWDGGPRIHKDLQTGGVIGVEEGKGYRRTEIGNVQSKPKKNL